MARFTEIKSTNPRLTQNELAKEIGFSSSSLLGYRQEFNMISPYRSSLNTIKRRQKITNTDSDNVERRQLTPSEIQITKD